MSKLERHEGGVVKRETCECESNTEIIVKTEVNSVLHARVQTVQTETFYNLLFFICSYGDIHLNKVVQPPVSLEKQTVLAPIEHYSTLATLCSLKTNSQDGLNKWGNCNTTIPLQLNRSVYTRKHNFYTLGLCKTNFPMGQLLENSF